MRLKYARLAKRYTLAELAQLAGCSESMISKIENEKLRPSIAMLHRLARTLETNVTALLAEPDGEISQVAITHEGNRLRIFSDSNMPEGDATWLERVIPPVFGGLLQAHILHLPANGRSDGLISHAGEKLGFILEGELELTVADKNYPLKEGDSFFFDSSLPHGYRNKGVGPVRVLWVNTPPSF